MEEIDALRRRVIASITAAGNPNSKFKKKATEPREEGEVSDDDDEEVPTCSDVNTMSGSSAASDVPSLKVEKRKRWQAGYALPASCFQSSLADMQKRTSTSQSYKKHIKRPPNKTHDTGWQGHSNLNDNLIISFSEGDDTDSTSEKSDSDRTSKGKVGMDKDDTSRRPIQTSILKHEMLQKKSINQITVLPTRTAAGHPSMPKVPSTYPRTSGFSGGPIVDKETSILKHTPANKTILRQEHGPVSDANMADDKLRSLRQQIAVRENELKLQKRSTPESKDRTVYSDKRYQTNNVKLDAAAFKTGSISNLPISDDSKQLKPDEHPCSISSNGLSQILVPGMKTISGMKVGPLETGDYLEVANRTRQLVNGNEKIVASINELHGGINSSLHVSSPMFPLQVKDKDHLMTSQQVDVIPCDNGALSSVNTDLNINDPGHHLLQEQSSIYREAILNWEESHDKELEEALEIRRKCELEEIHALKAYRKAREALIAANNRCSILYRKREEISLLASRCLSHGETVSKTSNELLSESHLIGVGEQSLDSVAYNLQMSGDGLRAQQSCKDDVNVTRVLENAATCSGPPNMHMNSGQGFLTDDELLQSKTACQNDEVNVSGETVDIDVETVHDFELEASLRSKLVAKFSVKPTPKCIPETYGSNIAQESEINANTSFCATQKDIPGTYVSNTAQESEMNVNAHMCMSNSLRNGQVNEGEKVDEGASNDSSTPLQDILLLKESIVPKQIAVLVKPSVMCAVCRHFRLLCPQSSIWNGEIIDADNTFSNGDRENSVCFSSLAALPHHNGDQAIDPFWPLCMFELRGKCNDEECPWQHLKDCSQKKTKQIEFSRFSSDKHADSLENLAKVNGFHKSSCSIQHTTMSIPTYRIGSFLMKSDAHIAQSMLTRGMWRYRQIGFCTSFPLPFSVQRILPLETQFLLASDIHHVDNDNWNRPSLYFTSEDRTLRHSKQLRGDPEQILDQLLDCFSPNNSNMRVTKKISEALSHALVDDQNSVLFWALYLQLYYWKEKQIGKDDMFFHAVKSNGGSYELWLLYINSRICLVDRLDAYRSALSVLCQQVHMPDKDISACILDLSLQMLDFLCMSGDITKAISCVFELCATTELANSNHILIPGVLSSLVIPDKCILLVCCVYLVLYRKLPAAIVQKFELEKDLPFAIEWPPTDASSKEKYQTLELMERTINSLAFGNDKTLYEENHSQYNLRSAHFLAISHINCVATLDDLDSAVGLLVKYAKMHPTCIELHLMSLRLKKISTSEVFIGGFQKELSMWPKEIPGSQCLWNQYADYALECGRIDFVEKLMGQWFNSFCGTQDLQYEEAEARMVGLCEFHEAEFYFTQKDSIFGLLNLCLYLFLQKNIKEALRAVGKALELATEQEYEHCVKEHSAFLFFSGSLQLHNKPHRAMLELVHRYLLDTRSCSSLEPLSRRFYRNIKKPRLKQLVNSILGPVSMNFSLLNSVLEVLHGPSLLPDQFKEPKDLVDYAESLMAIMPANYRLALSVCNFIRSNFNNAAFASKNVMFWGSSVLVNSVFQSFPVAPESVWLEAADVLSSLGIRDITEAFYCQAVSVYPFSRELWQSYLNLSKGTRKADSVRDAAKIRGFDLS